AELYEPLLVALVETGTGLEVDTSGLRQVSRETYPAPPVVERLRALGGTSPSAGSDAHRREAFTAGLEAGYGVAAAAGFSELAVRRGATRAPVQIPARLQRDTR